MEGICSQSGGQDAKFACEFGVVRRDGGSECGCSLAFSFPVPLVGIYIYISTFLLQTGRHRLAINSAVSIMQKDSREAWVVALGSGFTWLRPCTACIPTFKP